MPNTIAGALKSASERLGHPRSATAEAEELLGRLLGCRRAELYLERNRDLSPEQEARFESWLVRRAAGEPIQYITGRAAFRGLELEVNPSVLIPRPETEGVVEEVLEILRSEKRWSRPRVLDLGTGSGAIALAIATEFPSALMTASESSEAALAVARQNTSRLGMKDRIRFVSSDWFDGFEADERFEVVVSNPPYLSTAEWDELPGEIRNFEPSTALFSGPNGLDAVREIIDATPRHLVSDGVLALELAERRAEEVAGWLEGASEWGFVRLLDDLAGRPRVLVARRAGGPAIAPAQWKEDR
jgi:release factor glutamine methyltransferase